MRKAMLFKDDTEVLRGMSVVIHTFMESQYYEVLEMGKNVDQDNEEELSNEIKTAEAKQALVHTILQYMKEIIEKIERRINGECVE